MDRIAAPELEDFDWFPVVLRDAMTGFLRVSADFLNVAAGASPLVLEALEASDTERIVDLCSGGGGPVLSLVQALERDYGRRVPAVLTDKFPNLPAFDRAERELRGRVLTRRESTDATSVPAELRGVRTIFNAFHHLPPQVAKAVLADAAEKRQPILTFEFVERSFQGFGAVSQAPLAVYGFMPFVRPADPVALACTYALPIVPLATLWDGFASCLRAYSVGELEAMVVDLQRPDYRFRVERRRIPGRPVYLTSVFGKPI